MSEPVAVRTIRGDEVDRYRELRLTSLLDSPAAFTATWEQESSMPEGDWSARVQGSVAGESTIAVAETGGSFVGVAGGVSWGNRARVVGVWVDPAWRRRGLARQLVEQVWEWAAAAGYPEAQIETAVANPGPQDLYERLGFAASDEAPPAGCAQVLVRRLS